MSQSFRFEQVFASDVHDALWDWAQTSYGASDDWCILYLNGLPLGRLNPLWRKRLGQDWTGRQSILSDGLNLETDSWAEMGNSLQTLAQQWRECGWLKGWRGEKFDICDQSGKPLCALERAAFRPFGLMSQAVHLNGLVENRKPSALLDRPPQPAQSRRSKQTRQPDRRRHQQRREAV